MKEAIVDFDMRVVSTRQGTISSAKALTAQMPAGFLAKYGRRAELGAILKHKTPNRYGNAAGTQPNIVVSLQMCQATVPSGIERLLAVLDEATVSIPAGL
jgi:hypothetical protein